MAGLPGCFRFLSQYGVSGAHLWRGSALVAPLLPRLLLVCDPAGRTTGKAGLEFAYGSTRGGPGCEHAAGNVADALELVLGRGGGQARSGRKGLQLCRRRFWGRRLSSSVRAPASLIRLPASQIRAESRDAAGVIFRGSFVLEGWIGLRAGIILGERESKMEWFLGRTLRALFRFRQHKRGWQNDRWRKCLAICH